MLYFARRLAASIPILIGISLIAFMLGILSPGDPAVEALSLSGMKEPTEQEVQLKRVELGLDQPLPVQYGRWLLAAFQGDLGTSYMTRESVSGEIMSRLPVTMSVSVLAVWLAVGIGIPVGMLMALRRNSWLDYVGSVLALSLISIPGFLLAILLMTLFSEKLHWLPTSGYGTWKHLIMPALVLSSGTSAILMRLTRATLLEVMNHNYILAARAKGLRESIILLRHAFKNALIPLVTLIGSYFGAILGGSVIIEVIFALPGIGKLAIDGIFRRDYPIIQGYVIFAGLVYVIFNLLIDVAYTFIHPQIKLGVKLK
jgi:peptide/nickel transport system permease protein